MRTAKLCAKLFTLACAVVLFTLLIIQNGIVYLQDNPERTPLPKGLHSYKKVNNTKYILQWTPGSHSPFDFMGEGRSSFIINDCKYTNCFVTDDRNYFVNIQDFDAIAFNGKEIFNLNKRALPHARSHKQKYIFGALESSHFYPDCNKAFDNFFNWTWTYKLDSDARWGYIAVYNLEGEVVGPRVDMHWESNHNENISDDLKLRLEEKSKAAAWFVSNCKSKSGREDFVEEVIRELKPFGLSVDVYGACGKFKCLRNKYVECNNIIATEYYFYFAFENSFAPDYVTEKVLTALNNFAVPVVLGAANYSRFLPPGSYLNAIDLGPKNLAKTMNDIIIDRTKQKYYSYFRWRNSYRYTEIIKNIGVCNLCALMNDQVLFEKYSTYSDFKEWWNPSIDNICV